jgi:hypothetical protein
LFAIDQSTARPIAPTTGIKAIEKITAMLPERARRNLRRRLRKLVNKTMAQTPAAAVPTRIWDQGKINFGESRWRNRASSSDVREFAELATPSACFSGFCYRAKTLSR